MVSKTEREWLIFILRGPIKHKILSIVALNMAKYTIISLVFVDFVFLGGQDALKSSQVPFRGVVNPFQKSAKFKKVPTPVQSQSKWLEWWAQRAIHSQELGKFGA